MMMMDGVWGKISEIGGRVNIGGSASGREGRGIFLGPVQLADGGIYRVYTGRRGPAGRCFLRARGVALQFPLDTPDAAGQQAAAGGVGARYRGQGALLDPRHSL